MADQNRVKGPDAPKHTWLYDAAEVETAEVSQRLDSEFGKWPLIHFLMRHFSSMLFFAAQRLIDRKTKTGEERPRDEAVILSCPRLFNECYSGYLLARKGLVLQAIVLLRSAFELTTQALLFMQREDAAIEWLKGKKIKPKEVRELTSMPDTDRNLYRRLSSLAHPNYNAVRYYSAAVPMRGEARQAYFYGGWFGPKEAGQVAIQFLWAQLLFLETFYQTFSTDLQEHDLLWRKETVDEAFGGKMPPSDFDWQRYLGIWRSELAKLAEDHARNTAEDHLNVALALSDYGPEEKEQIRRGFEDAQESQT